MRAEYVNYIIWVKTTSKHFYAGILALHTNVTNKQDGRELTIDLFLLGNKLKLFCSVNVLRPKSQSLSFWKWFLHCYLLSKLKMESALWRWKTTTNASINCPYMKYDSSPKLSMVYILAYCAYMQTNCIEAPCPGGGTLKVALFSVLHANMHHWLFLFYLDTAATSLTYSL